MLKSYCLFFAVVTFLATSAFVLKDQSVHYSSGPDPGYCGDPANGFQTCVNCHNDFAVQSRPSVLSTDIPLTGYVPNKTYTIEVNISESGYSRYGFQVSPQNASGSFLGELIVTDENATQLNTIDPNYINHTFTGNDFPDEKGHWSFQWKAPEAGSGDVTFYGAFLISNKSSNPKGDIVAQSSATFHEDVINGMHGSSEKNMDLSLEVYPNPATEYIRYSFTLIKRGETEVSVVRSDGKQVAYSNLNILSAGDHEFSFPVDKFSKGIYLLKIKSGGMVSTKQFEVE